MLERTFDAYFPARSPKAMLKLSAYISDLNTKRRLLKDRQDDSGVESMAVRLLRQILAAADVPSLCRMDSDYNRYSNALLYIQDELERLYDPVTHGVTSNVFVADPDTRDCLEYHIPIRCTDYLEQLPMDLPWENWKSVRPVRFLDHDSPELTFHVYTGRVVFREAIPSVAVIGIDAVALVLQYVRFRLEYGFDTSIVNYLYKHVLVGGLLEDIQNIWLRRQYLTALRGEIPSPGASTSVNDTFSPVGARYGEAMKDLGKTIDQIKRLSVTPDVFLASLPFSEGLAGDQVQTLLRYTDIADARRYRWIEYLRDRTWLDMALCAYRLAPALTSSITAMREMTREVRLLEMTRFWEAVRNLKVRDFIETDFTRLTDLIDRTA